MNKTGAKTVMISFAVVGALAIMLTTMLIAVAAYPEFIEYG